MAALLLRLKMLLHDFVIMLRYSVYVILFDKFDAATCVRYNDIWLFH